MLYNYRLGDVGLARALEGGTHITFTHLAGTAGFLHPTPYTIHPAP